MYLEDKVVMGLCTYTYAREEGAKVYKRQNL